MAVYWDDKEKEELVVLTLNLRIRHPGPSLITLFNKAQEQIPEERRRFTPTLQTVPWLEPEIESRLRKYEVLSAETLSLRQTNAALLEQLSALKGRDPSYCTGEELLVLGVRKLKEEFENALIRARSIMPSSSPTPENTPNKKPTGPRVVIFMPMVGDQAAAMEAAGMIPVDVDKGVYPSADACIITKFCSHYLWDKAITIYPITIRTSGGRKAWIKKFEQAKDMIARGVKGAFND